MTRRRQKTLSRVLVRQAPPDPETVVGGRVDSRGRLMLKHLRGDETVAGNVRGDSQPPSMEMVEQAVESWVGSHPPADGRDATDEQVALAVSSYLGVNPPSPGKDATSTQVASAVSSYLSANPPAPGKDATSAQVASAVSSYLAANPPAPGKDGKDPTSAQVASAVADWMAANPVAQAVVGVEVPATTVTVGTQSRDIAVSWPKPWPDTAYDVTASVMTGLTLLGKIAPGAAKSKTKTSCVIPVDIAATVTAGGAKLYVLGLRQ